jgi:hypothetical protein
MTRFKSTTLFLLLLILFSCNSGNNKELAMMTPVKDEETSSIRVSDPAGKISTEAPIERKVIKRGDISFQTSSIQETTNFITKTVSELKGYISSDNVYNSDNRITQRLEIRISATSFDDLLTRISQNAKRIDSKNVQVQDITEEYIDIESRIKTKKELENRFKEILSKAKTVEEIVSIEKELGTLRTDIEAIEGRLKYLKDQVSLSTLTVEYYELSSSTLNFSSKLGQALIMGWRFLLSFIIGLVHIWPFLLILGITLIIIFKIGRKEKVKK